MATKLESLSTKLQSALDLANSLPDAITLDELTNPGSAATMLEGTEMLDAQGKKVTGSIETKDSSNLTASGATVNVPAGYYADDAMIEIETTEMAPLYASVSTNGVLTARVSVLDDGYIEADTQTYTQQLDTQAATTITPTKSSQTAVAAGKYTTGAVTVGPIPDQYQDVSNVTATAARTAAGDVFVDADGVEQTGKLNMSIIDIYSNEFGSQRIFGARLVDAGSQNFLRIDASDLGNAEECYVLSGYTFASNHAADIVNAAGTMPNNGTLSSTIDGLNTKSVSIPKGYTSGGTVALDSTIDDTADSQAAQIAEIMELLEGKSLSGGTSAVDTCTVSVSSGFFITSCVATTYENGEIVASKTEFNRTTSNETKEFIVNNVVCNSAFFVGTTAQIVASAANISGGGEFLGVVDHDPQRMVFKASDVAGGTMTVSIYDND